MRLLVENIARKLFDMGFGNDILEIIPKTPATSQTTTNLKASVQKKKPPM